MSADNIKINGYEYKLAIRPMCDPYPYGTEPDKKFITGWMEEDSDIKTNLLSDIVYYNPVNKLLCQTAIFTPPPQGELRLDDLPSAKVLYVDREGKREVSELKINCPDEDIKEKIEDIAEMAGTSKGSTITHREYSTFADEMKRFGLAKKKLITVTINMNKEDKLGMEIDVRDLPPKLVVRSAYKGKNGLKEEDIATLNAAVQEAMPVFPNMAIAMFYEPKSILFFLMNSEKGRELEFTPNIIGTKIEGDALVVEMAPLPHPPEVSIDWSPEYKDHIYSLPAKEQEDAMNALIEFRSYLFSSNNKQDLEYRLARLYHIAANGTARGTKSYILLIDKVEENNQITINLGRVASPTRLAPVEGDFPPEDKELLNGMVMPALRGASIDIDKLGEGMERIRKHYVEQGYKIKELKYEITHDRTLHVIVDLRRWDSIYTVEIMEHGAGDDERKEAAKLIDDIMDLYDRKFIKTEDIEAIKKKLRRGGMRPNIKELIATDPETKKTKAVFVTAKADKEYALSLGGGGSSFGMMMSTSFEVANDGSGRSFGGGMSFGSTWPSGTFSDWWTKEMYLGAVNLFMTTPLDKNKSLTVSVYGWKKNYEDPTAGDGRAEEWVTGGGVTYNQYFLNDSVVLSLGSNIEYFNLERPVKGYNDLPVRLKLKEGLCYKKNSTHLCVGNQTSLGKANYDKLTTNISYTIPLSSEENMPFVVLRGGGGTMMGNSPITEQFTQFDTGLPFMFSVSDGSIHFGKYFGGAAVELAQMLNSWLAIKPIVVVARTVGPYSSVSAGSCVDIGPLEACVGYRYGISRVSKGWELALGTNDLFQIPIPNTLRMLFANTFLKDKFEY